jgi:hypothetical protein
VKVAANHTLVGGAGTVFTLELRSGSNELRVTALNEGTSSPNTARLDISVTATGANARRPVIDLIYVKKLTITFDSHLLKC